MSKRSESFLERAKVHIANGMLRKGRLGDFADGFHGCSVGCHLHDILESEERFRSAAHPYRVVADSYGYPEWLAKLQGYVFEKLADEDGRNFHREFAAAIHAHDQKIDWQAVQHIFHIGTLGMTLEWAGKTREAITFVIELHRRALTEDVSPEEWTAAERSARVAAKSVAWEPQDILTWQEGASAVAAEAAVLSAQWIDETGASYWVAEQVRVSAVWFGEDFVEANTVRATLFDAMAQASDTEAALN